MTDEPFLCVNPAVPLRYRSEADRCAIAVRPDNAGNAASRPRRYWAPGSVLRVRFLDTRQLTRRVLTAASVWTEYANLRFRVVTSGPAEIRVSFRGTTNWSALGTDAVVPQLYPSDRPTMCLSGLPVAMSSTLVDRLVRHEFGHAIGLAHTEPEAGARRHQPLVLAAAAGEPGCGGQDLEDYPEQLGRAESIMQYGGSPCLDTVGLTRTDQALVSLIYPGKR